MININNLESQLPTAYKETFRIGGNIIWSPISNVDLGAEFLWGKRTNKDPDPVSGKFQQIICANDA